MEAETQELFRCGDCCKSFTKRIDYNRHRNRHEKPHLCSLCNKKFGLKTDLDRHRQTHRGRESRRNFKCKFLGCDFRGTSRKDYLWKHLQKNHREPQHSSSDKTLREYYAEFVRDGQTSQHEIDLELLEAVNAGDVEKVRNLLLRKANISTMNSDQQTPLLLATAKGHTAMVKLLCSHGADANSALVLAVSLGKEASLRMLIENGADINLHMIMKLGGETKRHTALYLAAYNGDERIASVLLEKGADTNPHNLSYWNCNETALHIAARMGEGITKILLEGNADVEAKDSSGYTPLSYAIGRGSWKSWPFNEVTTKLLLDAGATVSLQDWCMIPRWFREQNAKYVPTVSLEDWYGMPLWFRHENAKYAPTPPSSPLAPRLRFDP